jgi:hypothetical protein
MGNTHFHSLARDIDKPIRDVGPLKFAELSRAQKEKRRELQSSLYDRGSAIGIEGAQHQPELSRI